MSARYFHSSHWGAFEAELENGEVAAVHPFAGDPDPSLLLGNLAGSLRHRARVTQPAVRAGWLDDGPGADARRGPRGDVLGQREHRHVLRLH